MGTLLSNQEGTIPTVLDEFKSKKEQLYQRAMNSSGYSCAIKIYRTVVTDDAKSVAKLKKTLSGEDYDIPSEEILNKIVAAVKDM